MKCKKILAYGTLSLSLLQAVPFNCMAHPLQDEYIQQFGNLTQSVTGLKKIINKLNEAIGERPFHGIGSLNKADLLQQYLWNNYERFKPYISNVPYEDVKSKCNDLKKLKTEKDKERVNNRLNEFDPKGSLAIQSLERRFGELKQLELLNIAETVFSVVKDANPQSTIKLDRESKRRKLVLLKWFDENWCEIQPYIDDINFARI